MQSSKPLSNWLSSSNFVRPEPIISKPPVFLYWLMISSVNSIYLWSTNPEGPFKNPYNLDSLLIFLIPSKIPEITLWPPGACPPLSMTPTLIGLPS